jgi:hypothetical protein
VTTRPVTRPTTTAAASSGIRRLTGRAEGRALVAWDSSAMRASIGHGPKGGFLVQSEHHHRPVLREPGHSFLPVALPCLGAPPEAWFR